VALGGRRLSVSEAPRTAKRGEVIVIFTQSIDLQDITIVEKTCGDLGITSQKTCKFISYKSKDLREGGFVPHN